MTGLRYHLPPDRAVIAVAGEDRQPFLQGLISNDTAKITAERAIYATLLTAQPVASSPPRALSSAG